MHATASTARSGAIRWFAGVVLALCAALAVLVHHHAVPVTSAVPLSAGVVHAGSAATPLAAEPPQSSAGGHEGHRPDVQTPAPGSHDGACTSADIQHCTTANVDNFKLPAPPAASTAQDLAADQVAVITVPTSTVSRAPPTLSALCRLRI